MSTPSKQRTVMGVLSAPETSGPGYRGPQPRVGPDPSPERRLCAYSGSGLVEQVVQRCMPPMTALIRSYRYSRSER